MPLKMPKGYSPLVLSSRVIASKGPMKVAKMKTELVDQEMKRVNLMSRGTVQMRRMKTRKRAGIKGIPIPGNHVRHHVQP
jgi:hypothetical protein